MCNCENLRCVHGKEGKSCPNKQGAARIMYIGKVCDECAKRYDPKYRVE